MPKINLLVISARQHPALRNLAPLRDLSDITVTDNQAELEELAPAAEVIVLSGLTNKPVNYSDIWKRAKSTRWVHSLSAGVEMYLSPELVESDATLTNARGVFKRPLAEFALLGILFHFQNARRMLVSQRQRKWDNFQVKSAQGRVLGIVGFGEIGRECALLAKGLGLTIHAVRRHPDRSAYDSLADRIFKLEELHQMLAEVDVLLCAAALTPETYHMIGDGEFRVMKPSAIVINVSRGSVIDEAAMVRALQNNSIAGAALDVFEKEPLPDDSPLWSMDNVIISPHFLDQTENLDQIDASMRVFVDNFFRYLNGVALTNIVNKEAGY